MSERVLIVGAGAVGTVYGHFLQQGGADVSFYVRPKYASEVRRGLALYPLPALGRGLAGRRGSKRSPVTMIPDGVLSSADEVAVASREGAFDQIWLCVSATGLRSGVMESLAAAADTESTTWVVWTPGLEDRTYVGRFVPSDRIVQGVVSMIAYAAPLLGADERVSEPGTAFYLPPGMSQPVSGDRGRAQRVVSALVKGGCRAKVVKDVASTGALGSAVMMPYLLALEAAGWRFDALKGDHGLMELAAEAGREATAIVAAERAGPSEGTDLVAKAVEGVNQPWLLKFILSVGPRVLPLDLEAYFAYHFTKVRDQTRFMVEDYHRMGKDQARPTQALELLLSMTGDLSGGDEADAQPEDREG